MASWGRCNLNVFRSGQKHEDPLRYKLFTKISLSTSIPLSPMITELDLSCCESFSRFKDFTERGASFLSLLYDLNKSARHGPDNLENRNI